MEYDKKLKDLREKFEGKDTIKFIEFLEILYNWLDFLIKKKRISREEEKKLFTFFPKKIFDELDKLEPTKLVLQFEELKDLLLKETTNFLIETIKTGSVKMVDFDYIQFNLYGIFGKEKIASMVEHVRLKLESIILEKKTVEYEKEKKRKEDEKAWFEKINKMPEKELVKLITKTLFEFSPSARTHEERLEAIKKNQEIVLAQKDKFHDFEKKIIDATEEAKSNAEVNVNRQVGKVVRRVNVVSEEFREKAKEFVSDEGPKKMINKARERILEGKEKLNEDMKNKGKEWEKDFGVKIEGAKQRITAQGLKLAEEGKERREFIFTRAESELRQAGDMIKKETSDFQEDVNVAKKKFEGKAESVLERGKSELEKARTMIFKEKSEFKEEVGEVKLVFDRKGHEIESAKGEFIGKRNIAEELFTKRGSEIEEAMSGTIYEGREKFEGDRTKAQERFKERADEITISATKHISEKRDAFSKGRNMARERFLSKVGGIMGSESPTTNFGEVSKSKLSAGASIAKQRIEKAHNTMIDKAKLNRKIMQEKMNKQRELFLYEVRFAQKQIQDHAKEFSEHVLDKREEFETAQEKIVARHKARQKAQMIQTLLRTIRTMH